MRSLWTIVLFGGLASVSSAVMAQASSDANPPAASQSASPATSSSADEADELQEVVVTAEKRSEDLQTTPISISAVSGDTLSARGINSIAGLQYDVPGLSVSNTGIIPLVNIRGIGLALVSPNTSSGIINYRDGVLITHEPFLIDPYYDQQQIEVLRGPQGTLAGSNSTGGAILVTSRNPSLDGHLDGFIEQSFGDYDDYRTDGAVSIPLSSSWAARIAFNSENRNSYWDMVGSGNPDVVPSNNVPGALSQQGFRLTLYGKPADALTVLVKSEYNVNRGNGIPNQPTPFSPYYVDAPHVPYQLDYDDTSTLSSNIDWRSIVTLDWQFSPAAELRSQTAWFQGVNRESDDGDASSLHGQTTAFDVLFHTLQQEIDVLSTGQGPWQWTVGSFFYNDEVDNNTFLIHNYALPSGPLGPYQIQPYGPQKAMDYAFFGQTTFDLTKQWQLLLGARYTQNRRWAPNGGVAITPFPGGPVLLLPPSDLYNKGVATGKFGVNWNYGQDDLVYAFVARGAKSGGYNTPGPALFDPEYVLDYELGWKATFANGHLRTQLDGFYMDYKNFQLNQYNALTNASNVANIAHATDKGPEGQIQAVFGGLQLDGTFAYVDTSLGSAILYDTRYAQPIPFQVDGDELPFAPKWTANGGIQYAFPIRGVTLTPRIQVSYVSGQWAQVFESVVPMPAADLPSPGISNGFYNPLRNYMPAHDLWDLNLTWRPDNRWLVDFYGRNVFNKIYVQAINSSATTDNAYYGEPRTYGVRASYSF